MEWFEYRIDDGPIEIAVSIPAPYATYPGAEAMHALGVLAVVAAGLYLGRKLSQLPAVLAGARELSTGHSRRCAFQHVFTSASPVLDISRRACSLFHSYAPASPEREADHARSGYPSTADRRRRQRISPLRPDCVFDLRRHLVTLVISGTSASPADPGIRSDGDLGRAGSSPACAPIGARTSRRNLGKRSIGLPRSVR